MKTYMQTNDQAMTMIILAILLIFVKAWALMLMIGIIVNDVWVEGQGLGYPQSLALISLYTLLRTKVETKDA